MWNGTTLIAPRLLLAEFDVMTESLTFEAAKEVVMKTRTLYFIYPASKIDFGRLRQEG